MEENHNEIAKRLQDLIRQKTEENSALHKLLGKLKNSSETNMFPEEQNDNTDTV